MTAVAVNPTDPRVAYLGRLAGWSTFEALGRLATLRARCVELRTDTPGDLELEAVLDAAATQLVRAGLGELTADDGVRVLEVQLAKTGAERTRRWRALRDVTAEASQAVTVTGGDADVTQKPSPSVTVTSHVTIGDAKTVTRDVVDLLACASESLSDGSSSDLPEDPSSSGASDLAATARGSVREGARLLATEIWAAAAAAQAELRALDAYSVAWPRRPIGTARHVLAEVVVELLDYEDPDGARALAARRLVTAVAEARSRADDPLKYFTPIMYWRQFWEGVERKPKVVRARGSPRAADPTCHVMSSDDRAAMRAWLDEHL